MAAYVELTQHSSPQPRQPQQHDTQQHLKDNREKQYAMFPRSTSADLAANGSLDRPTGDKGCLCGRDVSLQLPEALQSYDRQG